MKSLMMIALIVFIAALVATLIYFDNGRSEQLSNCEQTAKALNENNLNEKLINWVDANIDKWEVVKDRSPLVYLASPGDFSVPLGVNLDVFKGDPAAQVVLDSSGAVVAVNILDQHGKSIVITKDPNRWYAWSPENLLQVSSRVAVVCTIRD